MHEPGTPLLDQQLHFHDPHHHLNTGVKIRARNLDFFYGEKHALKNLNMDIFEREVTAFIGPSGCGKTTFLRCLNRTNEVIPDTHMHGTIHMDGADIYDPRLDPVDVRKRFGWVAQKPNPFPGSIYRNVIYGPSIHGLVGNRAERDILVERSLRRAGLWDELKDRLKEPGTDLSGGQQQRLCIARAIAAEPDVLLMDEPCSALDPTATALVEELIEELAERFTIIIITHNMQQAARISQRTAFFHLGDLVEVGDTEEIFLRPRDERTLAFVTGRFG